MQSHENYLPHAAIAASLTVAVLVLFQVYLLREPVRIAADEARNLNADVTAGQTLFTKNCATCHGLNGEGSDDGPALNNKPFLSTTDDGTLFSVVSSGVPNTQMPAWNQAHGGPLTNEDVRQVVAYLRAWLPNAPDRSQEVKLGDAPRGAAIFAATCYACHGVDGKGTNRAPALNDPQRLNQFDDAWYRDTIMKGRPANGMPTWGTVLSPAQINDLVALLASWRTAAPTAITVTASVTTTSGITPTDQTARPSNPGGPGPALKLAGAVTAGAKVYAESCSKCHGEAGMGGVANPGSSDGTIPALNPIDETLLHKDAQVFAYNLDLFMEHGSTPGGNNPKEKMPAWGDEKKLTPQQIADVIAYVMSLNK
jgi:mono/diheme cytochrome c family protein